MPQTTRCPKCDVVLNLPEGVEGRRLRCPHCGERFLYGGTATLDEPPPDSGGSPTASGKTKRPSTSVLLTETPSPLGDRDLRETFSPDLLLSDDTPPKPKSKPGVGASPKPKSKPDAEALPKPKSKPAVEALPKPRSSNAGTPVADVAGLLDDDEGMPRRRLTSAEERVRPRRCPSCGAVVPPGMSLCRCGLDLDTGKRQILDEILEEAPPPPSAPLIPLSIAIPGGVVLLVSGLLTIMALIQSLQPGGESLGPISRQQGFLSLALIGGFGIYASVQFLRLKSFKMLIVALLIGAAIDMFGLIIVPIGRATQGVDQTAVTAPGMDDENLGRIAPVTESIDERELYYGIAILLADVGLTIFLLTPPVRQSFEHSRTGIGVPIG